MFKILKRMFLKNKYTTKGIFNPKINQEIYFTMYDNGSIYIDREMTMKDFSQKLYNLEKGLVNNHQMHGRA